MGKCAITEEIGAGLYKAAIQHDTVALLGEKLRIETQMAHYWRDLNRALDHRNLLRQDRAFYGEAVYALIDQWKQALQDKTKPPPPIVPEEADVDGNNPNTGQPYTDDERADTLENEVLDKINAERTAKGLAPLVRSLTLDAQVRNRLRDWDEPPLEQVPDLTSDAYLQMLLRQQSIQAEGKTVHDRLLAGAAGVVANSLIEAAASGQTSSAGVIAALQRDPETWEALMHEDATEMGASYRYAPGSPTGHHWAINALTPGHVPAGNAAFFAAPAGQALIDAVNTAVGEWAGDTLAAGNDGGSGGGGSGGGSWQEPWQPNYYYGIGAMVTGHRGSGKSIFIMRNGNQAGTSGDTEPEWPGPNSIIGDGDLTWRVLAQIPDETASQLESWYDAL